MSVLKRKSRIVTFRATPDEYDALGRSCLESGARSISAFARAAVLERIRVAGKPITISGDLTSLSHALNELDTSLRDASNKIRRLLGNADAKAGAAEHR